jgi:hypothetical protein
MLIPTVFVLIEVAKKKPAILARTRCHVLTLSCMKDCKEDSFLANFYGFW